MQIICIRNDYDCKHNYRQIKVQFLKNTMEY